MYFNETTNKTQLCYHSVLWSSLVALESNLLTLEKKSVKVIVNKSVKLVGNRKGVY